MRLSVRGIASLFSVALLVWLWLLSITWLMNHHVESRLLSVFAFWRSSPAAPGVSDATAQQKQSAASPAAAAGGSDRHSQLKGDEKLKKLVAKGSPNVAAEASSGTKGRSKQPQQQPQQQQQQQPPQQQQTQHKQQQQQQRKQQQQQHQQKKSQKQQKGKHNFTAQNYYGNVSQFARRLSWAELVRLPAAALSGGNEEALAELRSAEQLLQVCSATRVSAVTRPMLSDEAFKFCQWALASGPGNGNVKVGKSYGNLDGQQKEKYESYYCNSVDGGRNPTCDDAFGDEQIRSWRANPVDEKTVPLCGAPRSYTSRLHCSDSRSKARFCVFENALMDFAKMKTVSRAFSTDTRSWSRGFLSTDCDTTLDGPAINYYDFYAPKAKTRGATCDFVFDEPVLVVSHDQSKNLGHTMNDYMNTWAQLWLAGVGASVSQVTLLSLDAVREGHNYQDELFQFGMHYAKSFARVLRASDFLAAMPGGGEAPKVCFKRLVFLPRPYLLFTWDGWWQDLACPLLGPSAVFQRWNVQVRQSYGLLQPAVLEQTNKALHVLLVVREVGPDERDDAHFNTRVFANLPEIQAALRELLAAFSRENGGLPVRLTVQNLALLTFEEQVRLVSSVSLLIGTHGAGITHAMHMPVGTRYCCGVLEIFPFGEFTHIRGHGNMARRMGHRYDRILLGKNLTNAAASLPGNTQKFGVHVPLRLFNESMLGLLRAVAAGGPEERSCLMPSTLSDPYFDKNESFPKIWK